MINAKHWEDHFPTTSRWTNFYFSFLNTQEGHSKEQVTLIGIFWRNAEILPQKESHELVGLVN